MSEGDWEMFETFENLAVLDADYGKDVIREPSVFASSNEAFAELRGGRMIVIVDDEDRENEGDVMIAAEMITTEAINFMATHARSLICLAITGERADSLELNQMVPQNTSWCGTAFTVSIDARGRGVTTGISSRHRAQTILAAITSDTCPEDLARPGHVFPLRARTDGVLERRGQTEAAVDLARLAGMNPSGVICEIVNEDGAMARLADLTRFCVKHDLKLVSVADVAQYRFESASDELRTELEGTDLERLL
jgi:3,4-dihydroxy 2-butanone 4-phosphate synthase / GTP cyclohydrolase II